MFGCGERHLNMAFNNQHTTNIMMKKLMMVVTATMLLFTANAQIDKEKLALDVSKADAANLEKLKGYIWKRYSSAKVGGVEKPP
jgi:hypothetical protein